MDFTSHDLLVSPRTSRSQILTALRGWDSRQVSAAIAASVGIALVIGIATVLIPNPIFGRDIPPVWWNYPVWILTSIFSGMLIASYVKPRGAIDGDNGGETAGAQSEKSSRFGMAGAVLAWFAVGCPVCNKIALLALGYSGAITWFAPLQPILAIGALVLTGVALVWRLRGQVSCPTDTRKKGMVSQ